MFWLALHLPLLSLEAFCATLPPPAASQRSVALVAEHRITAVSPHAARRGVKPGMKRATAMALAPDILLAESLPARDAAALEAVAHTALAFTPAVARQDAQTVLLEVQPSLRLFGGVAALQQRLMQALAPLGHRVHIAAAPTALGAALLARWAPGDRGDLVSGPHGSDVPALQRLLDDAPVWLLGPGRVHWESLQGMGLRTLRDLRLMPRSGLARRFGAGMLAELDRAFGRASDPRTWIEPPRVFDARLELFARADTTEQVLHGAGVLLARLVAWAQARQSRIAAFTLQMHHEPRHRGSAEPATELRIEMAEPSLDAAHLQLLLRERLARCALAAPTLELQLQCSHLVQAAPPNGELFPTQHSASAGLARLLERLRARLGDEQVHHVLPVADHRPERASRSVPALAAVAAVALPPPPPPNLPLHRPVWLLPEPLRLRERDDLPLYESRPLPLLSGPERIETGWWDGAPVARDYYVGRAADGSLVWVWRERLAAPGMPDKWFLQGRFG